MTMLKLNRHHLAFERTVGASTERRPLQSFRHNKLIKGEWNEAPLSKQVNLHTGNRALQLLTRTRCQRRAGNGPSPVAYNPGTQVPAYRLRCGRCWQGCEY